ncbi:hypothetical protein PLESTB_001268300 [Pleodorina starrii]|uniref:Adhesin domain-containing protein n=1 Tax=Pleodorina starrii TaxID=330485 RepID=A0A9W6BTW5_9CHLO|nr:hypothetical protein PLESTB_001268300 [Pleodorina starrii]
MRVADACATATSLMPAPWLPAQLLPLLATTSQARDLEPMLALGWVGLRLSHPLPASLCSPSQPCSAARIHTSSAQQSPDPPSCPTSPSPASCASSSSSFAADASAAAVVIPNPVPGGVEPEGGDGGPSSSSAAATAAAAQVPLVPGTYFRVAAGGSAVRIDHVAGWSDVATLRGRPAGGGFWSTSPASVDSIPGPSSTAGVRQVYDVRQNVRQDAGADDGGLLQLDVPEKWIGFDICTSGRPVSVSKLSEADLRVTTSGAPVTLGSVRALRVEIDTTASVAGPDGDGDSGGEVSGTSISVTAAGPIRVRRLVGGSMRLATCTTGPCTTVSAPMAVAAVAAAAVAAPAAASGIELGAVYGGRLQLSTDGGAVRIGTLDCGGAAAVAAAAATADGSLPGDGRAGALPQQPGDGGSAAASANIQSYCGAEVLSYGGAVTLDGLEGDAIVDSGGGAITVLVQPGLRCARLASGGGPVEVALAPGTALRRLEVRRAATAVSVQPDLARHLEPLPPPSSSSAAAAAASSSSSSSSAAAAPLQGGGPGEDAALAGERREAGVWAAKLVSEAEGSGRGAGRGGSSGGGGGGVLVVDAGGGGGVLVVDAGGGAVSLRRLGWMEALRAKMEQRASGSSSTSSSSDRGSGSSG